MVPFTKVKVAVSVPSPMVKATPLLTTAEVTFNTPPLNVKLPPTLVMINSLTIRVPPVEQQVAVIDGQGAGAAAVGDNQGAIADLNQIV